LPCRQSDSAAKKENLIMVKSAVLAFSVILLSGCAAQSDFVPLTKAEQQTKINTLGATKSAALHKALAKNPELMAKELLLCERLKPVGTQIKQVYCRTIELVNVEGETTRDLFVKRM
jgi:hypothetical protein